MTHNQTFIDRCYRDKNGTVVIFQSPNPPLIVWIVSVIASHLIKTGTIHTVLLIISTVALIIWALLEVVFGVTYLRRLLGLLILVATVFSN